MEDCAICLEILNTDIINKWTCIHKFHCKCIKDWNKFCPLCETTELNNQNFEFYN